MRTLIGSDKMEPYSLTPVQGERDLMRAADFLRQDGRWAFDKLGCLGFSGGGIQTLWLAALDEQVTCAVISGYLYGCRNSLLVLSRNCSCNYVPHLWEHVDMGGIYERSGTDLIGKGVRNVNLIL